MSAEQKIDWAQVHQHVSASLTVAILFTRVVMWAFPLLALIIAGALYLLTQAVPPAAIFATAALVVHVVYRVKLYRLEHRPVMLLTARVVDKDRTQSANSTTQAWSHSITLDIEQQQLISPTGPEPAPGLRGTHKYTCQPVVYQGVELDQRRHFVRLGDDEIAGLIGDDGRVIRG